jgi:hypothetical protein
MRRGKVDSKPRPRLTVAEVADALGWRVERTRRLLLRHGACFQDGRYWYTTRDLLRAHFGDVIVHLDEAV